jgi:predicted nuclease of predicted toxin-antitoxin system
MAFRLYADENFPLPAVQRLRRLGHDVLTLQESGKGEQSIPDAAVLAFATEVDRAVLTLNRKDFIHLHRKNPRHAGILVCTFDSNFEDLAERVHQALQATDTLSQQLVRVQRPG